MRRTVACGIELARVALLFGAAMGLIRLNGIIPTVTGRAPRRASGYRRTALGVEPASFAGPQGVRIPTGFVASGAPPRQARR